ncbi:MULTISPECIES: hypothetical protein [Brevibacterium]|jgi:hypothetical protein|uniref:Septum formation-related domain-containing protein n=1 Tax=Brevibacterium casei TaxID=33889 RepID=A0A7T3ZWN0_9MICO|nr:MULTISPECIES: hypothetical protein [Brevibacterium]QQB13034.1 hypothetical protein I6H47_09130 [Brevibacterium casei]
MKRTTAIVSLVAVLVLSGCTRGGEDTSAPQPGPTSATEAGKPAPTDDETLVDEDSLPVGHCGVAPAPMTDQAIYQGTQDTDCDEARTALEALARGEGDDSEHVAGHGTIVDGWECLFPMDSEVADYDITLSCDKDEQRFVVRPASLDVPAGYHVLPWEYEGTATGAAGLYFTTESRKHHCSFQEDLLGCDNHSFPEDLPPVTYQGQQQQPTAIVLTSTGGPRFEAYGDPTFTQFSDAGEWGADTAVLPYGDLLIAYGIACTTDADREVVCTNGDHGFAISSRDYSLS